MVANTPLLTSTFDGNKVRSAHESSVLTGHFEKDCAIVPLVALKASTGAMDVVERWLTVTTQVSSMALPSDELLVSAHDIVTKTGRKILDISIEKIENPTVPVFSFAGNFEDFEMRKACDSIMSPWNIPQNGSFYLADHATIANGDMITGEFQVSPDFPWHDNNGQMDPAIMEEIAAQIVSMGYAKSKGFLARTRHDGAINDAYQSLTFVKSSVTFHTSEMPHIQDSPKLLLAGKVSGLNEKRVSSVDYVLSVRYPGSNHTAPVISWHIDANKTPIGVIRRAMQKIWNGYTVGNSAKPIIDWVAADAPRHSEVAA